MVLYFILFYNWRVRAFNMYIFMKLELVIKLPVSNKASSYPIYTCLINFEKLDGVPPCFCHCASLSSNPQRVVHSTFGLIQAPYVKAESCKL